MYDIMEMEYWELIVKLCDRYTHLAWDIPVYQSLPVYIEIRYFCIHLQYVCKFYVTVCYRKISKDISKN